MENLNIEKIIHCKTNAQLHKISGFKPSNDPLISFLTFPEFIRLSIGKSRFSGNFYLICLNKIMSGCVSYGKTRYDHCGGSMMFMSPRQIIEYKNVQLAEKSFIIVVHEDYFSGHGLYEQIRKYSYFDYEINEALHVTLEEEILIWDLFGKMKTEYNGNQDEMSKEIILSHLDSILKYSDRFFKRQFGNFGSKNYSGTSRKFNNALKNYFVTGQQQSQGLPSVNMLARELFVSSRYLSDLLKQETGKNALEHIHMYLITEAKNQLLGSNSNVSGVAYQLGFESPSYFTRLFKKVAGITPMKYKEQYLF